MPIRYDGDNLTARALGASPPIAASSAVPFHNAPAILHKYSSSGSAFDCSLTDREQPSSPRGAHVSLFPTLHGPSPPNPAASRPGTGESSTNATSKNGTNCLRSSRLHTPASEDGTAPRSAGRASGSLSKPASSPCSLLPPKATLNWDTAGSGTLGQRSTRSRVRLWERSSSAAAGAATRTIR